MNTDSHFDSIPTDQVVPGPAPLHYDILSIPNEILTNIFQLVPSLHVLPIALSHVCRLWRDVSLGSPELWVNIAINEDIGVWHMKHFRTTLRRVHHCIERSGDHALILDINISQNSIYYGYGELTIEHPTGHKIQKSFSSCIRSLSIILAPHVWRFKSFKLQYDIFSSVVDIQSSFPHVSMPFLEIWDVHQCDDGEYFESVPQDEVGLDRTYPRWTTLSVPLQPHGVVPGSCSVTFPRLRAARLSATPLDWPRFGPTNLQSLEITYLPTLLCPDGETFRQILLANAHALTTLKLHGASPTGRAIEPYVLPNISRLDLGYVDPDEFIPFVQDANLPSLECFVIEDVGLCVWDHMPLIRNIINHFPLHQLKAVEYRHISFSPHYLDHSELLPDLSGLLVPATIFEFLCKLSSLKNFTISGLDIGILNALNHVPPAGRGEYVSGSSLVPCLEVLRLEHCRIDDVRVFLETRVTCRSELHNIPQIIFFSDEWEQIREVVRSIDVLSITNSFEYVGSNPSHH